MGDYNFDTHQVDDSKADSFEPLPAGWYRVAATANKWKTPQSGGKDYLEYTFVVLQEQGKGRLLWDRFSVEAESEKGRNTSRARLKRFSLAVGLEKFEDTGELLNRPLEVRVKIVQDQNYPPKNEIATFRAISGEVSATQPTPTTTEDPAQGKPSWAQ